MTTKKKKPKKKNAYVSVWISPKTRRELEDFRESFKQEHGVKPNWDQTIQMLLKKASAKPPKKRRK